VSEKPYRKSASKARAAVFVLRVPGPVSPVEVEYVNADQISQHESLSKAFFLIDAIASNVPPDSDQDKWH
jgi:hypothetical protein